MKLRYIGSTGAAAALAFCLAASVSAAPQQPTQSPSQPPQPTAGQATRQSADTAQQVTITGCVQREEDYRRAHQAGKGGAAGTGVGAGNEFVLVNASPASSGSTASGAAAPGATGTAGTAGSAMAAMAYELTGEGEGKLAAHVGKRVEIIGKLKGSDPAGGPTAGAPPAGVDVTSKDLKLRELEVISVKEATGTCPTPQH